MTIAYLSSVALAAGIALASLAPGAGLPKDLHAEGVGNVYIGGPETPASVRIIGVVLSNSGKTAHEVTVTGLEILADGLPPPAELGKKKITSLTGEEVDRDRHPNGKKRAVDPLRLLPGDAVHVDIEIEEFQTRKNLLARVSVTVDGKKASMDVGLETKFRLPRNEQE
jgi:hypothetical protein